MGNGGNGLRLAEHQSYVDILAVVNLTHLLHNLDLFNLLLLGWLAFLVFCVWKNLLLCLFLSVGLLLRGLQLLGFLCLEEVVEFFCVCFHVSDFHISLNNGCLLRT